MKIASQKYVGAKRTYDIEVAHHDHQFYLANGSLTSNSHAVSYALDSYMCAYLLTHFEAEWLCAYAEEYASESDKKRARALSEIKALGYELVSVDVNLANKTWTILPGKKFMPSFTTLKGVGDAAVEEIIRHRPYHTVEDMLWNEDGTWKHSKFNKRVMETFIKVGAFESMDLIGPEKKFANYRHMHYCLVENWTLLKKKNGRAALEQLIEESRNIDDWTRDEKVSMCSELSGEINVDMIIPPKIMRRLKEKGFTSIDAIEEGNAGIHWFIVLDAKPMKTKKGKTYLKLNCIGEDNVQQKMNVWGWKPGGAQIKKYYGYLAEVEKSSWGLSSVIWKIREFGDD